MSNAGGALGSVYWDLLDAKNWVHELQLHNSDVHNTYTNH